MKSIHPLAYVEEGAILGEEVTIEPFAVVKKDVILHDHVTIKSHAYIDGFTTIGENSIIWPGAVIGTKTPDLKYHGEKTYVKIGKRCEIREYATINSSCGEETSVKVGDDCLIMKYCHVAHNCEIGNHVIIANNTQLAGHVIVEDYVVIGGMTPVHQFCRIGTHAMVGGFSGVGRDVPPYTIGSGFPYRVGGLNLIGLKRRGFTQEVRSALFHAFRLTYRMHLPLKEALERIEKEVELIPEVQKWLSFCRESKRGLIGFHEEKFEESMAKRIMKIIFFGTPFFAAHILEFLILHKIEIALVVCQPDRMQENRSAIIPAVKKSAQKLIPHIPILQPEKASDPHFLDSLESFQADLFIVAAYGQILKKRLLEMPKKMCINVHGSLLPNYRGAAPIQRALMNGDTITGITIMKMAEKMDAGDMIAKKSVPIPLAMTFGELEKVLYETAEPLLLEVIRDLEKGKISYEKQDESLVTYAPKILPEECLIFWDKSAMEVHNQIRSLSPHPGSYSFFSINGEKKRIKILKTLPVEEEVACKQVSFPSKERMVIGCKKGAVEVFLLQPEGKGVMETDAFLRGLGKKSFSLL